MRFTHVFLCLVIAMGAGVGCATGSSSGADGDSEQVAGEPPSEDEDDKAELPDGPEVQVGRSETKKREREESRADGGDDGEESGDVVTEEQIDDLIKRGPAYVLALVEVEPSQGDDGFEGFRIVGFDGTAKRAVDGQIRKGDVVTHVNGERLERPDDYHEAWEGLGGADRVEIDLLRDGEPHQAVWRIE